MSGLRPATGGDLSPDGVPSRPPFPVLGRLAALAALVPPASRVADVGTGHARLPVVLLAQGRAAWCLATERDAAALARARAGIGPAAADPRLALRWGDGLEPLEPADAVDVVVLAGMGARTLLRILDAGRERLVGVRRLVLQPQSEPGRLRRELVARGFSLVAERLARERGRFYEIIAAEPSGAPLPASRGLDEDDLLEVGPCLAASGDPNVLALWRERLLGCQRDLARSEPPGGATARAAQARRARRVLVALATGIEAPEPSGADLRSGSF